MVADYKNLKSNHPSAISHFWSGSGPGSAPPADKLRNGVLGADNNGISTGTVYHIVDGVWISTGATVANLYGG